MQPLCNFCPYSFCHRTFKEEVRRRFKVPNALWTEVLIWPLPYLQSLCRPDPEHLLQQGDQVLGMTSIGWTNERHSSYISSMEASFVEQLYGHENHGLVASRCRAIGNGFKVIQEGACKNLRFERNDARLQGGGIRCLPENPWIRRLRPRNVGVNCRGDGAEASVDDDGSGTDTVREKVRTHGREAKACAEENPTGKSKEVSDQNFSEEEVGATNEPCKKLRPTCSGSC